MGKFVIVDRSAVSGVVTPSKLREARALVEVGDSSYYVDRGHENVEGKLPGLGVPFERVPEYILT